MPTTATKTPKRADRRASATTPKRGPKPPPRQRERLHLMCACCGPLHLLRQMPAEV